MGPFLMKLMFTCWLLTGTSFLFAMVKWSTPDKAPEWVSTGLGIGALLSGLTFVVGMLWIIWAD